MNVANELYQHELKKRIHRAPEECAPVSWGNIEIPDRANFCENAPYIPIDFFSFRMISSTNGLIDMETMQSVILDIETACYELVFEKYASQLQKYPTTLNRWRSNIQCWDLNRFYYLGDVSMGDFLLVEKNTSRVLWKSFDLKNAMCTGEVLVNASFTKFLQCIRLVRDSDCPDDDLIRELGKIDRIAVDFSEEMPGWWYGLVAEILDGH